jgi:hypothetical protein
MWIQVRAVKRLFESTPAVSLVAHRDPSGDVP